MILLTEYLGIVYLIILHGVSNSDFLPVSKHILAVSTAIRESYKEDIGTNISSCDVLPDRVTRETNPISFRGPSNFLSL